MLSPDPQSRSGSFVEIFANDGEWFVRIVEHGRLTQLLSFEEEAAARSYADRQRLRLQMQPADGQ